MKNKKGFTLIELMIVIAIIAILAAIVVPNVLRVQDTSDCNVCQAWDKKLELLQKQYDKHIDVKHRKK